MKRSILPLFVAIGLVGSASAQLTGALTNGLVAYYGMNGSFNDSSGNENNLTTRSSGAILTIDRFGNNNSALQLTTDSDYAYSSKNIGITGNSSFTISLWLDYNVGLPHYVGDSIIAFGYPGIQTGGGANITFDYNYGGELYLWGGNDDTVIRNLGTDFFNNQWHQITYVYNSNNPNVNSFYIDGRLAENIFESTTTPNLIDSIVRLGDWQQYGGWHSGPDGASVDDVGVWNRALSSNEVSQLYSLQSVPEPYTYALFGIGAIGMLMVMRRKKTA